ncbi:hypothetical protein HMPREF0185_03287 [Brevundimonas diminuta 470-4]|nr:hypothetical protein HMPREF0185_03287 [Brevundimonas diminuta 470-4]
MIPAEVDATTGQGRGESVSAAPVRPAPFPAQWVMTEIEHRG